MTAEIPVIDLGLGLQKVKMVKTEDGGEVRFGTEVELSLIDGRLRMEFRCEDRVIWGTMEERDAPLFEEEVVEVFLGLGGDDSQHYFEFEINPDGVMWDGWISSPYLCRDGMVGESGWDFEGMKWGAERFDEQGYWTAFLELDMEALVGEAERLWGYEGGVPDELRLALYRIERPGGPMEPGKEVEFSAWSPTYRVPADFHWPRRFGRVLLRS